MNPFQMRSGINVKPGEEAMHKEKCGEKEIEEREK